MMIKVSKIYHCGQERLKFEFPCNIVVKLNKYQMLPGDFVFEVASGTEYLPGSMQNIIKAAAEKANIKKHAIMHTFRHTFVTYSLENNVYLQYIQSMIGHRSSKTTEIYTHITTKGFDKIKSPLDNLDI